MSTHTIPVSLCALCDIAGSAISTMLLGVAYYANIHHISYFIGIQVFGGIMQVYTQLTIALSLLSPSFSLQAGLVWYQSWVIGLEYNGIYTYYNIIYLLN